ncbi:unnamed protein product [Lactuca virosa]|uniref:Mechanosensitive ion channel protein n=1 Tax=Lactuca virosa TaxID=75947 RepID=A0AAU9MC12_9ASTR|nr:unnamed protein product [Lactuca virosa]
MDGNGKSSKTGEISMTENKSGEVVVPISGEEKYVKRATFGVTRDAKPGAVNESPHRKSVDSYVISSPNSNSPKTPNSETLSRRRTIARSIKSKPKSRFGEQPLIDPNMLDDMPEPVGQSSNSSMRISARSSSRIAGNTTASPTGTSSKETTRTSSITPKTPLMASPKGAGADKDDDEDEEIYKKVKIRRQLKLKRVKTKVLLQWVLLLLLVGCLIASLMIPKLKNYKIWSVELWKWFVLIIVKICGMLVINWLMQFVVLLIELNFLLRNKVLYFVHGLKKSVHVCLWLIGVLTTWIWLFNGHHVKRSKTATRVLDFLTWTIVSLLVGSVLWLLKTLLIKILATNFHVSNFFDKIQESIFLQYVILTLSGPPIMESLENVGGSNSKSQLSLSVKKKNGKDSKTKKGVIDVSKLYQMKREKVSAWTMKMLVDTISNSGLSTFSGELEESAYYNGDDSRESVDKEITNEMEAIAAAYHIFRNVAQPGSEYIEDIDLRRFMIREEVDIVFPMIDVAEKGKIDRKTLTDWVVKVFNGRKALAYALDDTKTAVDELNKLITAILIVVTIIVWLLLTEIASTKVLVFLSSQLVVAAFIFGNTCKTVFEAIVFVFMMHPFDVGDRCVIDGVQMVVEEMNILNTVFLRYDNEKIYYPNSVLATKPISNFYRSPDMGDKVEFSIDFATPFEKIGILKDMIKIYLEKNPQLWHPNHLFIVNEIQNVNMIKVALSINHTMNFQDYGEKSKRRSELVLELKKMFEELKIKCNLLPQEVHLRNLEAPTY